jgi:hypothetical protein
MAAAMYVRKVKSIAIGQVNETAVCDDDDR